MFVDFLEGFIAYLHGRYNVKEPYTYIFVRQDISLAQQLVQASHAALDAGKAFADVPHRNLVLIGVRSEHELFAIEQHLAESNIRFTTFYEPDGLMGHSAICTEALTDRNKRKRLSHFDLWKRREELEPEEFRTEQDSV